MDSKNFTRVHRAANIAENVCAEVFGEASDVGWKREPERKVSDLWWDVYTAVLQATR